MKIGRWQRFDGIVEAGFIHDDHAIPLRGGVGIDALITAGLPVALAAGRDLIASADRSDWRPLKSVRLLAPIVPGSVRDFVTFEEHIQGMVMRGGGATAEVPEAWYEAPTFYFTNPHTLIGPTDALIPPTTRQLDFELEVAAVIGAVHESDGRHMSVERSARQIFGYTIFNDWSARDIQNREMQVRLGPCKGKDFGATVGPWIVTADEFADRHDPDGFLDLRVEVEVNGVLVGEDTLTSMGWTFAEMIAYASRDSRVAPGDLLASGTSGAGCLAELWGRTGTLTPAPLSTGDAVTIRVDVIGEITTVIGAPRAEIHQIPQARSRRPAKVR